VALKVLEKIWPVTYNSRCHGGKFVWHTDQGDIVIKNNSKGMPYLDIQELEAKVALSFVQTVQGNMEGYMRHEVKEARAAREAQAMLGHPTDQEFLGVVRSGMILNCPVTPTAVKNANQIFCPDLAGVRGQMVRRPPKSMTTNHVKFPRAILVQHQRVTLAVDVMFVNGVPFLGSLSQGINPVAAEHTPSRTAKQLAAGIRHIMDLYLHGGFQVGTMLINNKFEKLRVLIPILIMNTTVAKEHLPKVERHICLIKECRRGILNTLLFTKMPQIMLIELIYHVVLWLNAFPTKSVVSTMLLPHKIAYRHKLDFAKHYKAQFGTYCEAHDEPTLTNTMVTCLTPAIVLGLTIYKAPTSVSTCSLEKKIK
jgi:hypothetical protein